jgi:hypothetical protein
MSSRPRRCGPQQLLVELADASLRNLGQEGPAFGHLPLRYGSGDELPQLARAGRLAWPQRDDCEGPLLPAVIGHADDRGFGDLGGEAMRFSRSIKEIHTPPDLITSFDRSISVRKQSCPVYPTSPVRSQPSLSHIERVS